MQPSSIYTSIISASAAGRKLFAVLIDPDKTPIAEIAQLTEAAQRHAVDFFLIGGSLITANTLDACLRTIRERCAIPTILFPGSILQINSRADGILLLSLLSGRNPELLIGQHVVAAPYLKESGLEIISTAYLLIDGGRPTTASYISNTSPIPADKPDIAACTAMAGEMLGFKLVYLDAGSGAQIQVSEETIRAVRQVVDLPLMVGGGIRTPEAARQSVAAGADLIVVGSAIERSPGLLGAFSQAIHGG